MSVSPSAAKNPQSRIPGVSPKHSASGGQSRMFAANKAPSSTTFADRIGKGLQSSVSPVRMETKNQDIVDPRVSGHFGPQISPVKIDDPVKDAPLAETSVSTQAVEKVTEASEFQNLEEECQKTNLPVFEDE